MILSPRAFDFRSLVAFTFFCVAGGAYGLEDAVGAAGLHALAQHGHLPPLFAKLHSRFGTPWVAILVNSFVVALLLPFSLSGTHRAEHVSLGVGVDS